MASIARRSPNGRRVSSYPTSEWARRIPAQAFSRYEDEAIILAYRWRTRLALNDAHLRLGRLMPNLSRSTLYRCLKRRELGRIGPTAICPPLTAAALRGPYTFEITTHQVDFRDRRHPRRGLPSPSRRRRDHEACLCGGRGATPENAAAFLAHLVANLPKRLLP